MTKLKHSLSFHLTFRLENHQRMQQEQRFTFYILYSNRAGLMALEEPLTFADETVARNVAKSFRPGQVTLRKDIVMSTGTVLHEELSLEVPIPVEVVEEAKPDFHVREVVQGNLDKEIVLYDYFNKIRPTAVVTDTIVETMIADALIILDPREFFPPWKGAHLKRDLTPEEQNHATQYEVAIEKFNLEWYRANLKKMSVDQIVKTVAFHADNTRDLGDVFWISLVKALDKLV